MILDKKDIQKIKKRKNFLEKNLHLKIDIVGENVELKGKEIDIYIGEKVLEAIDAGFAINRALLLLNEDYSFEKIPLKSVTRRKNLEPVIGRIIGTKGKTLRTLSELSGCFISLKDNVVSIIGPSEKLKEIVTAIKNLIRGSKQSNVYYFLERTKRDGEELGLK